MASRFYDSDVILGIATGDKRFGHLAEGEMATTKLNLMEVYYILRRAGRGNEAKEVFRGCMPNTIEIGEDDLLAAMDWRSDHFRKKTREFSYVDAIGYQVAQSSGMTFVTGDRKFAGYPGALVV